MADTHSVMPKKLAQALMEAGVQHFDAGGVVNPNMYNPEGAYPDGPIPGSGGYPQGIAPKPVVGAITPVAAPVPQAPVDPYRMGSAGDDPDPGPYGLASRGHQQLVYQHQNDLARQLLAQTQGQGPGQQMIAQMAGQTAAQQGALMASARGASSNPALIARQAAMAGAGAQQQGLNAEAQLQLQSQQALAAQQAQMASENLNNTGMTLGERASQEAAAAARNSANMSLASGVIGGALSGAGAYMGLHKADGGEIPGQAAVKGDSEKNDKVPAMLSPGEVIIPRSIAQAPDAPQRAAEFIAHLRSAKKKGFGGVVEARKARR